MATSLPDVFPHTIREINELPQTEKEAIYHSLISGWVLDYFDIDPVTFTKDGQSVVKLICPPGSWSMEMSIYHRPAAFEPSIYVHLADTRLNQLMVLLTKISDPTAPRFYIDILPNGTSTNLGTTHRNIPEEIRAMEAGLAPGQVRSGLRGFRQTVPDFEAFVSKMQHNLFMIEPLSYHNAIVFERYGFNYLYGKKDMEYIHQEFMPGGSLNAMLDGSTPFRQPDAWQSIRGRSWAIHDGILGHPFTGFQMYKRIGHEAEINTFPEGEW